MFYKYIIYFVLNLLLIREYYDKLLTTIFKKCNSNKYVR